MPLAVLLAFVGSIDGEPTEVVVGCIDCDWLGFGSSSARSGRTDGTSAASGRIAWFLFIYSLFACDLSRSWRLHTPVPVHCLTRRWLVVAPPTQAHSLSEYRDSELDEGTSSWIERSFYVSYPGTSVEVQRTGEFSKLRQ
jgi:hypothetical protein